MDNFEDLVSVTAFATLSSSLIAIAITLLYYKTFAYVRNRKAKAAQEAYNARQKARGVVFTPEAPSRRKQHTHSR